MRPNTVTEPSRVRNLAVLLVLVIVYIAIRIFVPPQSMADIVSVPMLLFGLFGLYLLLPETWAALWAGERDRRSLGLYGLAALLISVVAMRPYGIASRNIDGAKNWLDQTDILPVALAIQALGLWLFTRASETPTVASKHTGLGKIIAAFLIGVLVASSKMLEPILAFVSKLFSRVF